MQSTTRAIKGRTKGVSLSGAPIRWRGIPCAKCRRCFRLHDCKYRKESDMTERRKNPAAFKPGQSGNPKGKPKGARNHATRLVLSLMENGAKEITETIIDAAKGGDLAAARLVLERLAPPMRERPISVDLPSTDSADGIAAAQGVILQAVATGELLPGEGETLAGIVETRRKALETLELEARITALEGKQ